MRGSRRGLAQAHGAGGRPGFALLVVLFALALVGAVAAEFHATARADRLTTANARAATRARWAARAGLARALDQLHGGVRVGVRGHALLAATGDTLLPPIAFEDSGVTVRAVVLDARARVNLNRAGPEELARLLEALGLSRVEAGTIADRVLDWRDPDDAHRARGAEREAYEALRPPARPKDAPFDAVAELERVLGVTPELVGRVAPRLTVAGDGRVNVNSADVPVLRTLPGVDDAAARAIVARRARAPYRNVYELPATLPEPARSAMRHDMAAVLARVAFAPREVEIRVRAAGPGAGPGASLDAVVLLPGGESVRLLRVTER